MTQLVELRDAYEKFEAQGIRLYAISYDDGRVLREFSENYQIPYSLLSDLDSEVIRAYGVENAQLDESDGLLYGLPYPGTFVSDEDGVVVEKFFHDSYKKRDSAEVLIDSAIGRVLLDASEPVATGGSDEIRLQVSLHGGNGILKQGAQRRVVVRFDLQEGLHIYGEPVPEGMVPVTIVVNGPEGLVVGDPILPPTRPLRLEGLDLDLLVWSGCVDLQVPVYAISELASECRPLEQDSVQLEVVVRYQACDDRACLLPREETLHLDVPVDVVDVPSLPLHMGHGQREAFMDAKPHMIRLLRRKMLRYPLRGLSYMVKTARLELAARWRRMRS
ncbi:redoxin domain-containing protein [Myxococcota bacterium]|nr:redoxin domain-containing protein [Myxococcota bacterium]